MTFKFSSATGSDSKATTRPGGGDFTFSKYTPKKKPSPAEVNQLFGGFSAIGQTANSTKQQTGPFDYTAAPKLVGKIGKEVAQGTARDIPSAIATVSGKPEFTFTPSAKWEKLVFGDKPFSAEKEAVETGTALGFSEEGSRRFGPVILAGITAADFLSIPGKKRLLTDAMISAKNADDALKVLRNAKVPDEVIFGLKLDDKVIKAKSTKEVDTILKQIETAATEAKNVAKTAPSKIPVSEVTPSRVPTPGTKETPARFAEGAETMFKGAKFADETSFRPRNTAALARQADELIRTSEKAELDELLLRNDDLGTAVASEYLNKLSRDYSEATDLARKTDIAQEAARVANEKAVRLAEAGREIQAASLLSRLTPEGQLRYVASEINKYNKTAKPSKRVPELTAEQSREILDEMDAIRKTVDPTERQMKFFKLQRKVQGMIPSSTLRKLSTLWKAGLLTGIKTSGLNIFSNTSHFITETAKDVPAAAVDSVASLLTGKRTKTATFRNMLDGLKEGSYKGKRYFFSGFDERNVGDKIDYKRVNFGKGRVGRLFQAYTDQVFQTIGAQDQPFYYATLAKSYADQAKAQAINEGLKGKARLRRIHEIVENPTEEAMEYAVRDAKTAVFMQETKLGDAARHLQNTAGGAGEFVIPFGRTPSAVAMQIINYSPVGAVAETVRQIKKGKFDQRLFSEAVGRSTIGTIPLVIGWELAGQGMVSLDYPKGDSRQIELDKAEGVEYNSVKIGDEWRNPIVLGPAGNLLLLGAHMRNAIEKSGSPTESVVKGTLGMWNSFKEQTFLTGISNFVALIDDISGQGQNAFRGFLASFIPTIVSDVARATDTAEREVGSVGARIGSRIPGVRQTLEPKVDILGREQMIGGRGGEILPDFLESMIDPTRPSQNISTPVTQELSRLTKLAEELKNEDLRVVPTRTGLYGYEVLTDTQETQLQKYAGGIINDKLSNLFLRPEYQNATDEEKAKAINTLTTQAKNAARARIVLEVLQAVPQEKKADALRRMLQDGLITQGVERILNEIR